MARLPNPGGDIGNWGVILNDYLSVSHNADGTVKNIGVIAGKYTRPSGGIPMSDLAPAVQTAISQATGTDGADGADGREIQLGVSATHIQWRYVGDSSWNNLVPLADLAGPQGVQGPPGTNGQDGAEGPQGPPGVDGQDGTSVTIMGSYETESALNLAHPTGSLGDAYIVGEDLYVWNSTGWTNVGPIRGPQGEQGERGADGAEGQQGPPGTDGQDGADGAQGPPGTDGQDGADGEPGPQGPKGDPFQPPIYPNEAAVMQALADNEIAVGDIVGIESV